MWCTLMVSNPRPDPNLNPNPNPNQVYPDGLFVYDSLVIWYDAGH